MSGVTCESCGNPGKSKGGGWVRTICEPCEDQRAEKYKQYQEEREQAKLLGGGFEE
jgi:hypothetical protein